MNQFNLSRLSPKGDQPQAIEALSEAVLEGVSHSGAFRVEDTRQGKRQRNVSIDTLLQE